MATGTPADRTDHDAADAEVRAFVDAVPGATRRRDAERLLELFGRITHEPARMWYSTIIGFGSYHYRYDSGREGDAGAAGFSPRETSSTIYLPDGVGAHAEALATLGPHKTGLVCLYITDLTKVDLRVLEDIVTSSYLAVTAGVFASRAKESAAHAADPAAE
ncbi:DUF1801 domain-containing protein [Cryobacterium adonitolivorans]|uniref:DUF1801 domain-containing protein n=1 Tax=Cryobacterium adonitolivorans TaxID=1259189 RepID=A0A4R8W220_9MICO|nr:DUF1801 domain-containing protein [Cryobacterium adonitolivorans]TFB97504.1 DUF1801 domain-containing protein [Cryobacterium adonitolivorans]